MNRIIEVAAMAIGGVSLFLVCFVGFAAMSGRDVSQVAVIGKLFPAPKGEDAHPQDEAAAHPDPAAHGSTLSDAAVVEASLGVLSAWTLPSPYSTSELRVLSEEIKRKAGELQERELAVARRERALTASELELEDRRKSFEDLRLDLEELQAELQERELEVGRMESNAQANRDAGWADVAGVIATIDDTPTAARRLQEFEPQEAAKILRALNDDERAGEILNAVEGTRWKEYVSAYTAESRRSGSKRK